MSKRATVNYKCAECENVKESFEELIECGGCEACLCDECIVIYHDFSYCDDCAADKLEN